MSRTKDEAVCELPRTFGGRSKLMLRRTKGSERVSKKEL
ncbi:predicted protein [Botrytis cinerea T4]|uniref:Uncharacterized protein n=1 Tax=Botryotinia fuckeliana (strain T4) TaxID=999810 RepID=G2YZN7_BOTF4|nr:predicted protein [Botrytis cinerea T4]